MGALQSVKPLLRTVFDLKAASVPPVHPVPGLLCRVLVKRADFSSVCACWILISDVSVSKTWLRKNTARNTSYRSEGG